VRADDEAEFAGLVERQWMFAFRVAWGVLRNMHDAEDAAQEAFLKIFRAKAWRAAVDRLRGRAIQAGAASPERHEAEVGESAIEDLTSVGPNPEEAAMATDWEAAVHRLIDSLPEELRQPLVLSVEMNSREIAAAMGIAEGTVRTRLMGSG
jgi:RNA polymerase sigma-70 factor (ECF subfamily)